MKKSNQKAAASFLVVIVLILAVGGVGMLFDANVWCFPVLLIAFLGGVWLEMNGDLFLIEDEPTLPLQSLGGCYEQMLAITEYGRQVEVYFCVGSKHAYTGLDHWGNEVRVEHGYVVAGPEYGNDAWMESQPRYQIAR